MPLGAVHAPAASVLMLDHMPAAHHMDIGQGPIRVGITSGASTPDRVVEDVIRRLIALCGD